MLSTYPTIVHALSHHALNSSQNKKGFSFVQNSELDVDFLSFSELYKSAQSLAVSLERFGGEPVMLLFTNGKDFIQALLGCWLAGIIAVPCPVPQRPAQLKRLQQMALRDGITKIIIPEKTHNRISKKFSSFDESVFDFIWWEKISSSECPEIGRSPTFPNADDIALIQYTSGSTAQPKGIIITHGNFAANCAIIQKAFSLTGSDCSACWVPHYHDMGLVDGLLEPIYTGFNSVHIPSVLFLQTPLLWLKAIHKFKATYIGAPNFAYEICTKRIKVEELEMYPATHLKIMYNAAEPLQWKTIERFSQKFGHLGYPLSTHIACYGLAEATLGVTFSKVNEELFFFSIKPENLVAHQLQTKDSGKEVVTCGLPGFSTTVKIADELSNFLPEETIGEVWVNSPSVAHKGYWKNDKATAETFVKKSNGEEEMLWLKTGDLGFMQNNHLFITGRKKDLIKVYGQNIYPQDIEYCVTEALPLEPLGRSAAFQVDIEGAPKIVLVQEVSRKPSEIFYNELIQQISGVVFTEHGISLFDIVLVPKTEVLITTSGKVQRQANKQRYEDDQFSIYTSLQKNKHSHA